MMKFVFKMYPNSKFNQQTILTDKSDISLAINNALIISLDIISCKGLLNRIASKKGIRMKYFTVCARSSKN